MPNWWLILADAECIRTIGNTVISNVESNVEYDFLTGLQNKSNSIYHIKWLSKTECRCVFGAGASLRRPHQHSTRRNAQTSSDGSVVPSCTSMARQRDRSLGKFKRLWIFAWTKAIGLLLWWNQKGRVAKLVDASDSKSDTERYESSILSPPTARKASEVLIKRSVLNSQALPTASLITLSRTRWWLSLLAEYFPKISWNNWWPTALLLSSAFLSNKKRKRWVIRQPIYLLWI